MSRIQNILRITTPTHLQCHVLVAFLVFFQCVICMSTNNAHYADYLPYRQNGFIGLENFRTALSPPVHLRDRKMHVGPSSMTVEDVLANSIWPKNWPYSFEDFRPLDYTRDEPINTMAQYVFSQRYDTSSLSFDFHINNDPN